MSDTVVLSRTTSGDRRVYHDDHDCPRAPAVENAWEPPRDVAEDVADRCRECAGTAQSGRGDQDWESQRLLREAEPGDLMTDGGEDCVWVVRSDHGETPSVYHVDRDCGSLKQAGHIEHEPEHEVDDDLAACKHCAVEHQPPTKGAAKALLDAEPGDLVTDGGRDRRVPESYRSMWFTRLRQQRGESS